MEKNVITPCHVLILSINNGRMSVKKKFKLASSFFSTVATEYPCFLSAYLNALKLIMKIIAKMHHIAQTSIVQSKGKLAEINSFIESPTPASSLVTKHQFLIIVRKAMGLSDCIINCFFTFVTPSR